MKFLVLLSGLITIASAAVIPRDVQPIVVVDENGINPSLEPKSWGFSTCDYDEKEGAVVCKITQEWGAFAFQTPDSYIGGKLFATMKVKDEGTVQFQTQFQAPPGYFNFHSFTCTTDYKDYEQVIGDNPSFSGPVNVYAIQDASQNNNTLYIKKVIFYPPEDDGEETETGGNNTPGGNSSSGTGSNSDAPSSGTGSNSDAPSSGTGNSGAPSSGTGNSGAPSSGTGNSGAPSSGTGAPSPSPTKEADKDSGSTSVKATLFSIVLVQIIMAFVLM